MVPYWAVARSEPNRESTAASFLGKSGYAVYLPRLRERRRRVVTTTPLFLGGGTRDGASGSRR
jgi:hypothetical protein